MPTTFVRRAVSPLHFEPLRPDPDDVLCPGSDAEETPEAHKAKRRRVEDAGKQYLNGIPLYISSARLRGPFEGFANTISAGGKGGQGQRVKTSQRQSSRISAPQPHPLVPISSDKSSRRSADDASSCPPRTVRRVQIPIKGQAPVPIQNGLVRDGVRPAGYRSRAEQEPYRDQHHDWLKSRNLLSRVNATSRPTTPTPVARPRQQKRLPDQTYGIDPEDIDRQPATAVKVPAGIRPPARTVTELAFDEMSPKLKEAHMTVKKLSREAAERALYSWHSRHDAKKSSDSDGSVVREGAGAGEHGYVEQIKTSAMALMPVETYVGPSLTSPRTAPPSTYLPEFEYRSKKATKSPERTSFREDLEAAKKKARMEQKWRLSFTASGGVRDRGHRTSRGSRNPRSSRSAQSSKNSKNEPMDRSRAKAEKSSDNTDTSCTQLDRLQEAEGQQAPALNKTPSGPSTELLETDKLSKFPSTDEGDSYLGLSTQGALLKAQRSFHENPLSPVSNPGSEEAFLHDRCGEGKHTIVPNQTRLQDPHQLQDALEPKLATPEPDEGPMSTQAMIDALSPFVVTTVKKTGASDDRSERTPSMSRSSSIVSPTLQGFRTKSLSMSTTPSHSAAPPAEKPQAPPSAPSKAESPLTSFSFGAIGTDAFQHDGQQSQDYAMGDLDLDAAIEDAGSFLGDWNIEREVRNLGRSTAGSGTSTGRDSRLVSSH
ncbi:MAG: hypothetical protein Q9174_001838 [Haloplaca sp. 1 TL-2023]